MKTTAVISLLLVLLTTITTTSSATTWYVRPDSSGNFLTIQAAIDAAQDGDTILLAPGTLSGSGNTNVDFRGKSVVVCPEAGWGSTVIDCDSIARGFIFQSGEDSLAVLTGLKIMDGRANFYGGAVYCRSASPMIAGNVFIGNQSGYQGGGGLL